MVTNITAVGKYSRHIALFVHLLRLKEVRVSYRGDTIDDRLRGYYNRVCNIVGKQTKFESLTLTIENKSVLECIDINNPNEEVIEGITIICNDIDDAEEQLCEALQGVIDLGDCMLESTISHLVKRDVNEKELRFHANNNIKHGVNTFMWVCVLNACAETLPFGYRDTFLNAFKNMPRCRPRIAVLFSGYLRQNKHISHAQLINSPYVDIFIHTWSDKGFKNEKRLIDKSWLSDKAAPVSTETIIKQYNPKKILIEENNLDEFSLVGKISPIFLYSGQAKDDATRYINSQLYSINAAYNLMKQYETEENFRYDAIMRVRFDFNITHLDWSGIIEDIKQDCIYFPHASCNSHRHAGGGGGCLSCDAGQEHDKHTNDICDIWFYGNRETAARACQIYEQGLNIMLASQEANMKMLAEHKAYTEKDGYVYISSTRDIENRYVCFYPERMLREGLVGIPCKSSRRMSGKI